MNIDWTRCATVPHPHQKTGVEWLLTPFDIARGRIIPNVYLLGDAVGVGKSKQVVDTSQFLFTDYKTIDTMVLVTPAFARGVWADPDPALGEVAKHAHLPVGNTIVEYSVRNDRLVAPPSDQLLWIVTNYEFIRRPERLLPLMQFLKGRRYWLVPDESWALSDHTTAQWQAVAALRHTGWVPESRGRKDPTWKAIRQTGIESARITLLNGTPVADTPLDLFAQARLLHSTILGFKYFSHFRARYAVMRPNSSFPMITGWQNLEELFSKVSPYILRREVQQCEILEPVLIEARLSETTWRIYKQMRDEMVAWLNTDEASVAKQAMTKGMRLAQITSGFLGGVEEIPNLLSDSMDELLPPEQTGPVRVLSCEKLDALMGFLSQQRPLPNRLVVWSRFRPEIERTALALAGDGERQTYKLYGARSKGDRDESKAAIRALNPDIPVDGPIAVVAHAAAGGAALNFSGASLDITLSYDFSLRIYTQKRGRINRGRRRPIQYVDVVATGPQGQRTVDHHVLAALRGKEDIASWGASMWKQKLLSE